jgi:hypothetical protein
VLKPLFPAGIASVCQSEPKRLCFHREFRDICGVESLMKEQGLTEPKRLTEGKCTEERKIGEAADELELCYSDRLRHCHKPECSHTVVVGLKRDNLNVRAIMPAFLGLPPSIIVATWIVLNLWRKGNWSWVGENMRDEIIGETHGMLLDVVSQQSIPCVVSIFLSGEAELGSTKPAGIETRTGCGLSRLQVVHHLGTDGDILAFVHKTRRIGQFRMVI